MANKRISELPAAAAITGTELVEIVQGGTNVKSTVSAIGSGGAGTVTSFSAGNLTGLFTTSVNTPTTTPALSFGFENQNANTVLAGPTTAPAAAPTFRALVAADIPSLSSLYWTLASGGTLTGNNTIASGTNTLGFTYTGTGTTVPYTFVTSITATANSQAMVAFDLNTTFANGGFTNTINVGLKVRTGRVGFGIGSATPSASLHLRGEGTTSTTNTFIIQDSSSNNLFRVLDDGLQRIGDAGSPPNVGAGTYATGASSKSGDSFYVNAIGGVIFQNASTGQGIKFTGSVAPGAGIDIRTIYDVHAYNFTTGTNTTYAYDYNPTFTGTTGLTRYGIVIRPAEAFNGFGLAAAQPTAVVHLSAVTSARASLRIEAGSTTTAPSSPNSGDIWHQGTNNRLMFYKGASSQEIMCSVQVNSVSPTAPDRTIQLTLDGTTYYIHAKTTND